MHSNRYAFDETEKSDFSGFVNIIKIIIALMFLIIIIGIIRRCRKPKRRQRPIIWDDFTGLDPITYRIPTENSSIIYSHHIRITDIYFY